MKKLMLVLLAVLFLNGCGDDPVSPVNSNTTFTMYPPDGNYIVDHYLKDKRNINYPEIERISHIKPFVGSDSIYSLIDVYKNGYFWTSENITAKWDSIYAGNWGDDFLIGDDVSNLIVYLDLITDNIGYKSNIINQLLHLNVKGLKVFILPTNRQTITGKDTVNDYVFYIYHEIDPN